MLRAKISTQSCDFNQRNIYLQRPYNVEDRDLLSSNTDLVLTYYHGKRVLELYTLAWTDNNLTRWAKKVSESLPAKLFAC